YEKAMAVAKPLTERSDGDVQSYQILGMVYKATEQRKECEKMYKQALKKFPESGVLYNEYGEVIGTENGPAAIKLWEKGIEADPGFATNYYNASKYYYTKNEKMWCALYGEIFANMESYSARTAEMKGILLAVYKKIFADEALLKNQKIKNEFESAVVNGLSAQANAVSNGVNTETLTVMRTEFILSWFNQKITRFPFRLFDYQQQLLKEGMFNAYNEWLFGAEEDLAKFQTWTKTHDEEYNRFIAFQKGRIFKVPGGQYYQAIAK
ncbi:MAG: hypothetical protein JST13_01070, partial [Bacteroidetes bacterium]|nr:hypothetical protein [Bacteroidota bacterium]